MHSNVTFTLPLSWATKVLLDGIAGSCAGGEETKFQSSSAVVDAAFVDAGVGAIMLAIPVGLKVPDAGLPFCWLEGVLGRELDEMRAAKGSMAVLCG